MRDRSWSNGTHRVGTFQMLVKAEVFGTNGDYQL
jgi:hypothetical protein